MAGKDEVHDIILEELKYIRGKLDDIATKVDRHEEKLDTGNKSEKTAAAAAIVSVLMAALVIVGNIVYFTYEKASACREPRGIEQRRGMGDEKDNRNG